MRGCASLSPLNAFMPAILLWYALVIHLVFGIVHKLEDNGVPHRRMITPNALTSNTLTNNALTSNALTSNGLATNALAGNSLTANSLTSNALIGNGLAGNGLAGNGLAGNGLASNALASNALASNALASNALASNALTSNSILTNSILTNAILANALASNSLSQNALTSNSITMNTLVANAIVQDVIVQDDSNNTNALFQNDSSNVLIHATFDQLNFVRLVLKYASVVNITFSNTSTLANATKWVLLNVSVTELRGSELMGSLFAEIEGQIYEIPLNGTDMTGLMWQYGTEDEDAGLMLGTMRISHVSTVNNTGEIYIYNISSFNWTDGEWNSVCNKNGTDYEAVFLNGYWDPVNETKMYSPRALTIACRHYALAKCVEWGYMPWKNATYCAPNNNNGTCETVSLEDYHMACTRMCRADYCGNGTGWTADGTLIDIWDDLTPPIQPRAEHNWQIEAEWNMEGAVCLNETRLAKWDKIGQPQCSNKPTLRSQLFPACGAGVGLRAMLGTSFPPRSTLPTQSSSSTSTSSSSNLVQVVVPSVVGGVLVLALGIATYICLKKRQSWKAQESPKSSKQETSTEQESPPSSKQELPTEQEAPPLSKQETPTETLISEV